MSTRRALGLLLSLGALVPSAAGAATPFAVPTSQPAANRAGLDLGRVQVGQPLFWEGAAFAPTAPAVSQLALGSAACGLAVQCHDYRVELAGGGDRLRVAVDQTRICDVLDLEVLDPRGRVAAAGTTDTLDYAAPTEARALGVSSAQADKLGLACGFSTELFVDRPAAGTWTLRVVGSRITDTAWRGRLKLERTRQVPAGHGEALPDLVSTPPFELTFTGPEPHPSGCRQDEIRNEGARRCLRFSIGPQNRGEGALDLRYASVEGVTSKGRIRQRIYGRDGSVVRERDAGTFEYHKEHRHYHYGGFGLLELHRIDGDTMTKVSKGPKTGACTLPYGLNDWHTFTAAVRGSAPHDCAAASPAQGAAIGLESGWTDIYSWYLEGNYVEFGGLSDGRYAVVVGTDTANEVLESDEENNTSYAVVDVRGDAVTVVERGFGTGPFDPDKRPADDRYPSRL